MSEVSREEQMIREYVSMGGDLFMIKSIDVIRDGGTIAIETTASVEPLNPKFYIHKTNKTFHSKYEPSDKNLIIDPFLINYLLDRIASYNARMEHSLNYNKKLLIDLTQLHGKQP